eukprot:Lithocolla_globosa_v1_NODE_2423_length_2012_cov_36.100153.p1 type:complete len:293 gc:universal NODE_2423_length_2012_cov_36.100153:1037-1915(+)
MTYIDDNHILGEVNTAIAASRFLLQKLSSLLNLRPDHFTAKFEGFSLDPSSRALVESAFPVKMSHEGLMVMGAPVGTPAFLVDTAANKTRKPLKGLSNLKLLNNKQCENLVLRYCAVSSFTHVQRKAPPSATLGPSQALDVAIAAEIKRIFCLRGTLPQRAQLSLRKGGLGHLSIAARASDQYADGWCSSLRTLPTHFPGLKPALEEWVAGSSHQSLALASALQHLPNLKNPKTGAHAFPQTRVEACTLGARIHVSRRALSARQSALWTDTYQKSSLAERAHILSCAGPCIL